MNYTSIQRREASEWFVILRDARELPDDTLQAWEQWLSASDGNARAFKAVEQAYHQSALSLAAPLMFKSKKDDYDGSIAVADWRSHRRRPRPLWWAAAAIVLVAIGGMAARQFWFNWPVSSGHFTTRTSEHRELSLADGSRITLGARSRLLVHLTDSAREIQLDSGEAYFSVSKDPRRPFTVRTLNGSITAVGTAFNVRTSENQLTVAVTEGAVRVNDRLQLKPGEQLYFDPRSPAPEIKAVSITHFNKDDPTRWRQGWLVYRNEPLRYVIADVARYSNIQLGIDGAVAHDLRFTGVIHKDDVAEWLTALPEIFPVNIESNGASLRIAPRPEKKISTPLPISPGSTS